MKPARPLPARTFMEAFEMLERDESPDPYKRTVCTLQMYRREPEPTRSCCAICQDRHYTRAMERRSRSTKFYGQRICDPCYAIEDAYTR